ncbi:hypothetical protein ACNKHR_15640 [Shigella flexneri]
MEKTAIPVVVTNNGRITTVTSVVVTSRPLGIVDFKCNKDGIRQLLNVLIRSEPFANIALVLYKDGERRYILAPKGLKAGHQIQSGVDAAIKAGNTLPMRHSGWFYRS